MKTKRVVDGQTSDDLKCVSISRLYIVESVIVSE